MLKRKIPKFVRVICVLGVLLTIVSAVVVTSNAAGNYTDTLFKYEFTSSSRTTAHTEFRGKWDYTSSYAYNYNSNVKINSVLVQAPVSIYFLDCTYGQPQDLPIGYAKYLPNLVKEKGYNEAKLCFIFTPKTPPTKTSLCILWSPDSI